MSQQKVKKSGSKISVGILEDNQNMVLALKIQLTRPDMEVCVASRSLEEFYAGILECRPRIAIVDLRIPPDFEGGYEAIKKVREISPDTRCIIYTAYEGLENFHKGIGLGVRAFVSKNIDEIPLDDVVRIVASGGNYFGSFLPEYVEKVKDQYPGLAFPMSSPPVAQMDVSDRELEILQLLGQELSQAAIGERLVISENTVKAHTKSIRKKFGVSSNPEAVRIARLRGII